MEKFALLNLLKAIDGLGKDTKPTEEPAAGRPADAAQPPRAREELPNFMYEQLLRHEAVSNRLKNRRTQK